MASRHGQKGICSRLWATVDLPWTESGTMPDLIFNPHGFPSRMTVGMMVEFLAGKAAMVNGRVYDSTPFVFTEEYPAEKHFGEILREAGMNYYGMERMYSGISGEELEGKVHFYLFLGRTSQGFSVKERKIANINRQNDKKNII